MDIKELAQLSLHELQVAYAKQELSPTEIVNLMLTQVDDTSDALNALYGVRYEEARQEASASEARYRAGEQIGEFDGIPVTIKDSVNAVGMKWHHGSAIHGDGVVGTKDAPPVARLKSAGTIILGKTTMPDFGLSGSGVSGSHGITRNPWGLSWNPGGSSAGGAASLAAGIGMMSLGSDIAGSVRLPAGHCGLAALKPTQGVIPHAPASTVRSAGPITRKASDLDAWTRMLLGPDEDDRYSMPYGGSLKTTKPVVGASADFGFGPAVEPAVMRCFMQVKTVLEELVGSVENVTKTADFDAYLPIDNSLKIRGWMEYSKADPVLRNKTPECLYTWFEEAQTWTPERVGQVDEGIEKGVAYCVELLSDIDFLLTPVMPIVNFPAENRGIDPAMPLRHATFTSLFNQSGNPAVSICGGFDERGLPIGIQLVGKRFDDARLLKMATDLEARLAIYGRDRKQWPIVPVGKLGGVNDE